LAVYNIQSAYCDLD